MVKADGEPDMIYWLNSFGKKGFLTINGSMADSVKIAQYCPSIYGNRKLGWVNPVIKWKILNLVDYIARQIPNYNIPWSGIPFK